MERLLQDECAELAAALVSCADRIAQQCCERLAAPAGAESSARVFDVPLALREMTDDLRTGASDYGAARPDEPGPAASLPLRTLSHFRLLQQCILKQLAAHLGRELTTRESALLSNAIDRAAARRVQAAIERQAEEFRAASEVQDGYISLLSHDLRGSLNGVMLMLEVMKRDLEKRPELSETIEDIQMMRQSMLETVTMMERHIHADKLRKGRIEPARRPARLDAIVARAVDRIQEQAALQKLQIAVDVPREAIVEADPDLLATALDNLIGNALKYAAPGALRISARRRPEATPTWELSISDTGPGISQDKLQVLLDPVRRLQAKQRGLGLTIARDAARLSGGDLEADARVGQGSTFRLLLPEVRLP